MIIDNLITDRTITDVEDAKRIILSANTNGWDSLSIADKNAFLGGLRGAYNASDMNRVGEAILYIKELLARKGIIADVEPKTDWNVQNIPTRANIVAYIDTIKRIVEIGENLAGTRAELVGGTLVTGKVLMGGLVSYTSRTEKSITAIPNDLSGSTYEDWNAIEQALVDVYRLIVEVYGE